MALLTAAAVLATALAVQARRSELVAERERDRAEERLYLADMHRGYRCAVGDNLAGLRAVLDAHRPRPG